MFRIFYLLAVFGFPLLVVGCSDDTTPPSAPNAEQTLQAARPTPATTVTLSQSSYHRYHFKGVFAVAEFSSSDPSGCISTDMLVEGTEETYPYPETSRPTTTSWAFIGVDQYNDCTNEVLFSYNGWTDGVTFRFDRGRLTTARLQAMIPVHDVVRDADVQMKVDVVWTGDGLIVSESSRYHARFLGVWMELQQSKGVSRSATATGTVAVGGKNFIPPDGTSWSASISRTRWGDLRLWRH